MGPANVHVKKNQGLAVHRTGDRPEAALSDRHEVKVNKKTSASMLGLFPPGRSTNTLKFFANFKKKPHKQRKPAAESWSPTKHSADPQSVSLSGRCSAWSTSSRSSASSVTGQVYLEEQKQVV